MVPSLKVKPPRVKRSPVHFECKYLQTVPLVGSDGSKNRSEIIIGEVVGVHIDESIIRDGKVDITKARPIARLGYWDYCVVNEVFEDGSPEDTPRPRWRSRGVRGGRLSFRGAAKAQGRHFPLNVGLRFSTKAFWASFASSVCESSTVTDCSKR